MLTKSEAIKQACRALTNDPTDAIVIVQHTQEPKGYEWSYVAAALTFNPFDHTWVATLWDGGSKTIDSETQTEITAALANPGQLTLVTVEEALKLARQSAVTGQAAYFVLMETATNDHSWTPAFGYDPANHPGTVAVACVWPQGHQIFA
jgi:hypothetical protein